MPNYKITIKYDGTDFYGWQSQPKGNTIQDEITSAIQRITQEKINLIGSGRTDSGVHALGQVANFSTIQNIEINKFQHSLNSVLPFSISVNKIELCSENFNSRFDAKKRSYLYFIGKSKNPFYEKYSYYFPHKENLDISHLNMLSKKFIGEFDFTSFCKTNTETKNKICSVYNCNWRENEDLIIFRIEANRFLHGMVRTIVGTLLYANLHTKNGSYIEQIIKSKNREAAGEAAPAKGLFLFKVKY